MHMKLPQELETITITCDHLNINKKQNTQYEDKNNKKHSKPPKQTQIQLGTIETKIKGRSFRTIQTKTKGGALGPLKSQEHNLRPQNQKSKLEKHLD